MKLERHDYISIALNTVGAAVNLTIAWWAWPYWGAAANVFVAGICVGSAALTPVFVNMRVIYRRAIDDTGNEIARTFAEMRRDMTSPAAIEQQRAMMQLFTDGLLDGLKRQGLLDPDVHIKVGLEHEEISVKPKSVH